MNDELLVTPQQLSELIANGKCVVMDCRFELANPEKGEQDYLAAHIPGARYAHLDRDLSSPVTALSGRHPLPASADFAAFLGRVGWTSDKVLVVHDDRNNAFAARLWWLMRYFGHGAVLLDGGLEGWAAAGLPLESGQVQPVPAQPPELFEAPARSVSASTILAALGSPAITLIDARAPERFSGQIEPLDSRAGHIPGALNRPLGLNLAASGSFKSPQALRSEFVQLLQGRDIDTVVHSCGSGVTACHNQFAMELAGLGVTKVYPGSWSEWIRDPQRPIETGS